jgi:hypothetical protein
MDYCWDHYHYELSLVFGQETFPNSIPQVVWNIVEHKIEEGEMSHEPATKMLVSVGFNLNYLRNPRRIAETFTL